MLKPYQLTRSRVCNLLYMTWLFFKPPRGHFSQSNGAKCFEKKNYFGASITERSQRNKAVGDNKELYSGVCVDDGGPIQSVTKIQLSFVGESRGRYGSAFYTEEWGIWG